MTLEFVRPIQSSVITMLVRSVFFYLSKCLFVIIIIYAYFIYTSQGSTVEEYLWFGGIYNDHIIANFP